MLLASDVLHGKTLIKRCIIVHHILVGAIQAARKKLGLSTTELAIRLGVSQSTAVRLEQSENAKSISLRSLERAARALGFHVRIALEPIDPGISAPKQRRRKRVRIERKVGSAIAKALDNEVMLYAASLSFNQRIEQVCALSDLGQELRDV